MNKLLLCLALLGCGKDTPMGLSYEGAALEATKLVGDYMTCYGATEMWLCTNWKPLQYTPTYTRLVICQRYTCAVVSASEAAK